MEIAKITSEQARRITAANEDHFLDLKSIDIGPGKLTRAISVFLECITFALPTWQFDLARNEPCEMLHIPAQRA